MLWILTRKNEVINISKTTRINITEYFDNEQYSAEIHIEAHFGDETIVLDSFSPDADLVAEDVFSQLLFAIDGASENKVINLADISKRAMYEFQTGKEYKE